MFVALDILGQTKDVPSSLARHNELIVCPITLDTFKKV